MTRINQSTTVGLGIADVIGPHRGEILRLAADHGARNVRIFGSVARDQATDVSDLDLLVDWDYAQISAWGGVGFAMAVEVLIGRKVDVVSAKWLDPLIRDSVLREAVPL